MVCVLPRVMMMIPRPALRLREVPNPVRSQPRTPENRSKVHRKVAEELYVLGCRRSELTELFGVKRWV